VTVETCPDCRREKWTDAVDPDTLGLCECPALKKVEPYRYGEEDDPEEIT